MPCPSCAAPVPLFVAAERWSCGACDAGGTLPDEVAERLAAAARVLQEHDATERQLKGVARSTVTRASTARAVFLVLVAMVTAPVLLYGALETLKLLTTNGAEFVLALGQVLGLVPMALLVGLQVLFALFLFSRARRRVALAAAAVPAAGSSGGFACHVCGGPLTAGLSGVERCGYCSADNVVDAEVVAAATASRRVELEDYAGAVVAESGAIHGALGCSTVLFLAVVVISPFTCVIPMWFLVFGGWAVGMVVWILAMSTQPPTAGNRYGLVEVDGRDCVAWYNPYLERWERYRAHRTDRYDVEVTGVREVPLQDLLGRELEVVFLDHDHLGDTGVASKAHWGWYAHRDGRTLDGPDRVYLDRPNGRRVSVALWETCVVESR